MKLQEAMEALMSLAPQAFRPLRDEADYDAALSLVELLMDVVGPNKDGLDPPHPLGPLFDLLTERIVAYEDVHYPLPEDHMANAPTPPPSMTRSPNDN